MQGGRIEKVRRCVVPGVKSWARHWSLNLAALSFVVKYSLCNCTKFVKE